jgi:predicted deacylase
VVTTELGGGGRVPAPVHALAWSGLTNVLRHVGVLDGEVQTRASLGLEPAVILDGRDPANIVLAPEDGLFEALFEPGDSVAAGQPVGRLWFVDTPSRPPVELEAPLDGVVSATKAIPVTEQGDCVFVLGQPIERAELL